MFTDEGCQVNALGLKGPVHSSGCGKSLVSVPGRVSELSSPKGEDLATRKT